MHPAIHTRQPLRRSADHVWPLRDATGRTWADRKAAATAQADLMRNELRAQPVLPSSPRT